MDYTAATVRKWKQNLDHGDIKKISLQSGKDRDTISDAINKGTGSLETALVINAFVAEKINLLKS